MQRSLLLAVLLTVSACSSASGDGVTTTTTTPVAPPAVTTTSSTTLAPATTTTTEPLEPSAPEFDTWAIVLESLPKDETTLEDAFIRAVGFGSPSNVLDSDAYPSLNPGFWVLFNGPYDSRANADLRCDALRGGSPPVNCYTRYLGGDLGVGVSFEAGTAIATVENGYAVYDLESGDKIRTIETPEEARYREQPQLALDGTVAFFTGSVEDSWFSCDSAKGFIDRIDLATGDLDRYATGSSVTVAPGGGYLAYLEASTCMPDPFESQFVLAVPDTIVVVDLSTDEITRWAPGTNVVGQVGSFVTSLAWGSNSSYLLAVIGDGSLRRLEPAQVMAVDELPIIDATFVDPLNLQSRASGSIDVIAGRSETSLVAHRWSSIGSGRDGAVLNSNEIIEINPRSGAVVRTVTVLDDRWPLISLDASNGNLLILDQSGDVLYDPSSRFPIVENRAGGADW